MLKLATWNIGSLYDGNESRLEALERTLSLYSPDIISIEEMPEEDSLIERIKVVLGVEYHKFVRCSASHIAAGKNMGICVFSRYHLETVSILHINELEIMDFECKGRMEHLHRKYFMATEAMTPDKGRVLIITGHGYPVHRYSIPEKIFAPSFSQIDGWLSELLLSYDVERTYMLCDFNIPDPLRYMERVSPCFKDPLRFVGTRPSGRKTDSVIVPAAAPVYELINTPVGFDHNFVMVGV